MIVWGTTGVNRLPQHNRQLLGAMGRGIIALISVSLLGTPAAVAAQTAGDTDAPVSLRDTFQIGSADGAVCQVQAELRDPAMRGIFDRSWVIVCRDAAQPVGRVYALRGDDALQRIAARPMAINCGPISVSTARSGTECAPVVAGLTTRRLVQRVGVTTFVAEGLTVYEDALRLALDSIIDNRLAVGTINVATTSVGDPDALARLQAGTLSADTALAEGYRRNNSGDYAAAAVFFEALERRDHSAEIGIDPTEFTLNRALQMSNLGDFGEAERLFAAVETAMTTDIVQIRLRRNFRAMHALNQRDFDGAVAFLDQAIAPLVEGGAQSDGSIAITRALAGGINSGANATLLTQVSGETKLTPEERALLLDAQAGQIRGTALRLQNNIDGARTALDNAMDNAVAVRNGRVTTIVRLRSQIMGEQALVEEAAGNLTGADRLLTDAIRLLEVEYPETLALAAARAKQAAFYSRHERADEAITNYRRVIAALVAQRRQLTGLYNQMGPYYRLLVERQSRDPSAIGEFFLASQLLVRPGIADTQATLARELSGGSSDAATLFRQANTLTRDLERARIELARLTALDQASSTESLRQEAQVRIDSLAQQQVATLARLAAFPQYRAVSQDALTLTELQSSLGAGEAYVKLTIVGEAIYGLYATRNDAQLWTLPINRQQLDSAVDQLRASISVFEGGTYNTYPFEAEASHALFGQLFGPIAGRLASVRHLIFEPDGAMLRLPVNVLITDESSIARYRARTNAAGGDPFDMRGIAWLGRSTRVTTAVSPLAFRNTRTAPASHARNSYLGMGSNLPVSNVTQVAAVRGADPASAIGCQWGLEQWNRPIAATELNEAKNIIGGTVVTGAAFTDRQLLGRRDLSDYRILHFATHGLVTPPRPECPNTPSLLTSFDSQDSDGLLSFDEIFGMRLDADLVILSACDTAGEASIAATRAAGITTGGGTALDGLVRAFVGAGGRTILASHWVAPDDFNATERLIAGLFRAQAGVSIADSLGQAQDLLMDDARTSHPYYWAGFAIIGDGARPMLTSAMPATTAAMANPNGVVATAGAALAGL